MWQDPIVAEIRKIRDDYAKQFNYDLDAMIRDLKEFEKKAGLRVVRLSPKPFEPNRELIPAKG